MKRSCTILGPNIVIRTLLVVFDDPTLALNYHGYVFFLKT